MFRGNTIQRQPHDQSRGRGQSRGALHSSSDAGSHAFEQERRENAAKRELRGNTANNDPRRGGRGGGSLSNRGGFTKHSSQNNESGRPSRESSPAPNPFAKTTSRTTSPAPTTTNPFASKPNPSASVNPFGASNGTNTMSNPFGLPAQPASTGVFGVPLSKPSPSVFGAPFSNTTTSVFGAPSSTTSTSVFGAPSNPQSSTFNPFGTPSTSDGVKPSNPFSSNTKSDTAVAGPSTQSPFGAAASETSSISQSSALPKSKKFGPQGLDPFASKSPKPTPTFGAASKPLLSSNQSASTFGAPSAFKPSLSSTSTTLNAFGTPSSTPFAGITPSSSTPAVFGSSNSSTTSSNLGAPSTSTTNGTVPKANGRPKVKESAIQKSSKASRTAWAEWAQKLSDHLKKEGIVRPTYPGNAGDPSESAKVDNFFRGPLRKYREKVRKSFMKANLMDDPNKPKKLSDAIDFKGTCEDMCPFKECFERIMEGPSGVSFLEKERSPTGDLWPSLDKMVKKHSRSAAGDEEPLPEDIRSPPTLRRTVDYLMNTILCSDEDLPKVHGFLWDRTRAIRRDFIFQQAAMSNGQMGDLVYCLEHIIRFHILALHQMSKRGIAESEYNEQQELEQLQKAMISLIHAYGDCAAQDVECENEAEFRAYNLVLFAETPRVYDGLEQAKRRLRGNLKEINAGVAILECLKTCWEKNGPLKPFRPTDQDNNPFYKFFQKVAGDHTWYLLACFAEIHFNSLRKSALKHILKAFRQNGEQTQEYTLTNLQTTLNFDTLEDIVTFSEKHGLKFEDIDGEKRLSPKSPQQFTAPHPRPRQIHSWKNVEVKRGPLSLSAIIDGDVYQDDKISGQNGGKVTGSNADMEGSQTKVTGGEDYDIDLTAPADEDEEDSLFVKDNTITAKPQTQANTILQSAPEKKVEPRPAFSFGGQSTSQNFGKPAPSVFDQVKTVKSFDSGFFTQGLAGSSSTNPPAPTTSTPQAPSALFSPPAAQASFILPPPSKIAEASINPFPALDNYTTTRTPVVDPASISFGGYSVSRPSTPTVEATTSSVLPKSSSMQQALPSPFFGAQLAQPAISAPIGNTASTPSFAPQVQPSQPTITPVEAPFQQPSASFSPSSTASNSSLGVFGQAAPSIVPSQTPPAINSLPAPTSKSSSINLSQPSLPDVPQISAQAKREALIQNTSTWYAIGTDGILPHFTEFMVEGLLEKVFNEFKAEEAAEIARRELEAANRLADEHRRRVVGIKFMARWRHIAHIRWVRRQAVAARQLRKEMFEASMAKKAAASANLVEDFESSTRSKRGRPQSLGNTLAATGVLNGVHDRSASIRTIASSPKRRQTTKQPSERAQQINHIHAKQSVNGTTSIVKKSGSQLDSSLSSSRHGKSTADNPLRRSLLDHPSYLNGESRIFYAKTWTIQDEMRERPSGTQTDYFRLKARGIHTMYDGTPLASSVASLKQPRDAESRSDSRRHSTNSYGRSTSSRGFANSEISSKGNDVGGLNPNARASMDQDRTSRKRRSVDVDDKEDADLISRVKRLKEQMADDREEFRKSQSTENDGEGDSEKRRSVALNFTEEEIEILARSKRVKEQMDEGVLWYQEQVEKDSQREESRGRSRGSFGYRQ